MNHVANSNKVSRNLLERFHSCDTSIEETPAESRNLFPSTMKTERTLKGHTEKLHRNDTAVVGAIRALQSTIRALTKERDSLKEENQVLKTKYEDVEKTLKEDAALIEKELLAALADVKIRDEEYNELKQGYRKLREENKELGEKFVKERQSNELLHEKIKMLEQDACEYQQIIEENARIYERAMEDREKKMAEKYEHLRKEHEMYKEVSIQKIADLQKALEHCGTMDNFTFSNKGESKSVTPERIREEIRHLEEVIFVLNGEYKDLLAKIRNKKLGYDQKAFIRQRLDELSEIIQSRSEDLISLKEQEQDYL